MIQFDRRRHYRIKIKDATADCCGDCSAGHYTVKDLSRSGVLLRGAPKLPVDSQLRMLLQVPGFDPLEIDGTVVRHGATRRSKTEIAVEFGFLQDSEQDIIADTIAREVVRELCPTVLVGDPSAREGATIARILRSVGYEPIRVRTPLDVVRHLEPSNPSIGAVVLGDSLGIMDSEEVATFLAVEYPRIRRIMVTNQDRETQDPTSNLAHAIICKPWTKDAMRSALCKGLLSP